MDAFLNLIDSIVRLFWNLLDVILHLVVLIVPHLPILAWVAFWLLAVNWAKAFPILRRGGYIGLLLLMLVAVLVWGAAAPPPGGKHVLFGLSVSNYVGKFIYVTTLTCIALICGSVQLSGVLGRFGVFPEEPAEEDHHHHGAHEFA